MVVDVHSVPFLQLWSSDHYIELRDSRQDSPSPSFQTYGHPHLGQLLPRVDAIEAGLPLSPTVAHSLASISPAISLDQTRAPNSHQQDQTMYGAILVLHTGLRRSAPLCLLYWPVDRAVSTPTCPMERLSLAPLHLHGSLLLACRLSLGAITDTMPSQEAPRLSNRAKVHPHNIK